MRSKSSCAEPGCHRIAEPGGRCDQHKPAPWADARSRAVRYGVLTRGPMRRLAADIRRRDHHTCRLCNRDVPPGAGAVDHRVPRSRGGPTVESHLQLVCDDCHARKTRRETHPAMTVSR